MQRRGFLAGILAAGFAPAAIGSGVLMPVRRIVTPQVILDVPKVLIQDLNKHYIDHHHFYPKGLTIKDLRGNVIFFAGPVKYAPH